MLLLKLILVVCLCYIAYEDIRSRTISLYAVVVFLGASLAYSFSMQKANDALYAAMVNLIILAMQFAFTWLYFIVVRKHRRSFIDRSIGMGDIIFYIPVLFLFSPLNFLFIHIASLLFVLTAFALYTAAVRRIKTIPLAGGISVFLLIVLGAAWLHKPAMLYDDMLLGDILYAFS
ncbi:MAG TPA: hypothetical protein VHO90_07145 [Bacteroidales bacterium]|nr:hypothetical protein [Bacteroidales bacterium]